MAFHRRTCKYVQHRLRRCIARATTRRKLMRTIDDRVDSIAKDVDTALR
jgi:hypothetical protein